MPSLSLFPLILCISPPPLHPLYLFFPSSSLSFSTHPLYLSPTLIPYLFFPSSSLSLFLLVLFFSFYLIHFIFFSFIFFYLFFPWSFLFPPPPPLSSLSLPLILFISFSLCLLYLFFPSSSLSLFPLILYISYSLCSSSFYLFLCPATKKVAGYYVIPSEILSVILVLLISFSSHLLAFLSHFFLFCEMLHCTNPFIIILSIISIWLKPWHAEQIKVPSLLLIFIQSHQLIQVVYTNSHI